MTTEDGLACFRAAGNWYRGNLHAHSTASDGQVPPAGVAQWYRKQGYDFLALTDHCTITEAAFPDGLLAIPGVELNTQVVRAGRTGLYHVLGLGVSPVCRCDVSESPQELIDAVRSAGGLAVIAHPHWSGNVIDAEFLGLEGYAGIECFNYACEVENHKGFGTGYWDELLLHGKRVWGLATDDSHWQTDDSCGGWLMVKAPQLTAGAVLAAIAAGCFYSSSGPAIYDVQLAGNQITVRCSPARAVHFVGDGPWGRSVWAREDKWIAEATYTLSGRERFIRIEVVDPQHRPAWTNPVFLHP